MTTLEILGKLEAFKGFERSRDPRRFRWMAQINESAYTGENYRPAGEYKNRRLQLLCGAMLAAARLRTAGRDLISRAGQS